MVNNRQSENDQSTGTGADQTRGGEDSSPLSVTRRLTRILMEEGEGEGGGDLILQRSEGEDGGVLQWLSALDMQVMGACRADERLKPLLKLNASSGVVDDPLLSHLSQHFEPFEVGVLARCLCVPLVSIRVGKVIKEGTRLSPTSVRGILRLTLLPTSDLRISFNGDDGSTERLATLSAKTSCPGIIIEEISADVSGRSFLIRTSDDMVSYYWCSEKSKLLGDELLLKMKDLLVRKPSLAELSGISESRLNCFAIHLRAYLSESILSSTRARGILEASFFPDDSEQRCCQSSFNCQKGSRPVQCGGFVSKTNLAYQGSLSPRTSSFKENLPRSLSTIRNGTRGKFRRRGESYAPLSIVPSNCLKSSRSDCFQKDKLSEADRTLTLTSANFLDVIPNSIDLPPPDLDKQDLSAGSSHFFPQCCWSPPVASALQYTLNSSNLPILSTESLSLPPLSSLMASKSSLNLSDIPPLNFPRLLPNPLLRLPTLPSPLQIPTFTPLICDPIVHIPVIDVCSSGQGYLVSAGTALSTTIPPLKHNRVDSLLPNAESTAEKSARETLQMLISGSSNQHGSQLLMPSFLSNNSDEQNAFVTGIRGLYSGTKDVDSFSNNQPILFSERLMESGIGKNSTSRDGINDPKEKPYSSGSSSSGSWSD